MYNLASHARTGEVVLQTVSTLIGFDDTSQLPEQPGIPKKSVRNVITRQHALHSGLTLRDQDDNQLVIDYEYDRLGRVIREIAAPATAYEAIRTFTYRIQPGQQAEQSVTDVKGVQIRTLVDGLNRVVHEELINSDPTDPERVIRTYSARYNARGQLVQDTVYDWWALDGVMDERAMTTRYRYDDWGQTSRVTGPDGVVTVTENDPIKLEQRSWRESSTGEPRISERNLTTLNLFEKPVKIQQLDARQNVVAEREYFYNGLGNCVMQFDEVGEQTLFEYDAWSRLLTTTLPDGTLVNQRYAQHSPASLPVDLQVTPDNSSEKPFLAGQQQFDGLSRLEALHVGYRTLRYEYKEGLSQPSRHLTAKGKEIHYEYQLGLTGRPVGIVDENEQVNFTYDVHSAQLLQSQNTQGRYEFDYDKSGRLLGERWIEAGQSWETRYTSTPSGRPLSRDDMNGLNTTYGYNEFGQVESIQQGQLRGQFSYNNLGQLQSLYNQDLSADTSVRTEREYDEHGRETLRTLTPSGHPTQTLRLTYCLDSKLATRQLREDGRLLLQESYTYDSRGRLQQYNCSGDSLPRDRYGNEITKQLFAFDALDNVTHAWTDFKDGSSDEMSCEFAESDPCQLVKVTHSHLDYLKEFPWGIELSYDEDGHLERDERGHTLNYDVQGRLLGVTTMSGDPISRYRYDGHNQLLGVKHGFGSETLRFYQDDRVSSTRQGDTRINYFYGNEQLMGQQTVGDDAQTLLFLTDSKNSVVGESQEQALRMAVYNAYGERYSAKPMQSPLGFNGEPRDEINDWYLLGKGYRAYNPHLRRFHSPDSFSPFGAGGVNPYVYCLSDPINYVDPTGHEALWQYSYLPRKRDAGAMAWIGIGIGLVFTVASAGTLAPAAAAIAAGASAAAVASGLLTISSFIASSISVGTGVAAIVTGDETLGKVSAFSGFTAAGTGATSSVVGRFAAKGLKAGASTNVGKLDSGSAMKMSRANLAKKTSAVNPGKSTFADDLVSGAPISIPRPVGGREPNWVTDILSDKFRNYLDPTAPRATEPAWVRLSADAIKNNQIPRARTGRNYINTVTTSNPSDNPRDLALAELY
ncbi:RHS repeat-associated core domain-containing protein [Pseudomonas serbica]|uniref:RHS repeat-associated core domain-containing protein n=1 Tax=Pseudomonas serbica TaxID=2965074 RepID=UPI0039E4ABEA